MSKRKVNGRKINQRQIEECWLVCCEGRTEVEYLRKLYDDFPEPKPKIQFGNNGKLCDCKSSKRVKGECIRQGPDIVKKVEQCRAYGNDFDRIFIVFDCDANDGMRVNDIKNRFDDAIKLAVQKGFIPLWSNPCFEVWLLLHNNLFDTAYDANMCQVKIMKLLKNMISNQNVKCDSYVCPNRPRCNSEYACENRAVHKPFCNSYSVLGGREAIEKAVRNNKMQLQKVDQNMNFRNSKKYSRIVPGTNLYKFVEMLDEYSKKHIK